MLYRCGSHTCFILESHSPNAEEALGLLSMPLPPTKESIESACSKLLNMGVGKGGNGYVIIRSGAMGAFVACREKKGQWVNAYWNEDESAHIVDVTGRRNMISILCGLR